MYSIGRRIGRNRILYCWKHLIGFVPNCGLNIKYNDTSGTILEEIPMGSYYLKERMNSFHFTAPRLFNKLPRDLRDLRNVTLLKWKIKLDEFFKQIPDTPQVTDLTPGLCDFYTSKPSNSLSHWIPYFKLTSRR